MEDLNPIPRSPPSLPFSLLPLNSHTFDDNIISFNLAIVTAHSLSSISTLPSPPFHFPPP
jgi:hypothetical protein